MLILYDEAFDTLLIYFYNNSNKLMFHDCYGEHEPEKWKTHNSAFDDFKEMKEFMVRQDCIVIHEEPPIQ